MDGRRKKDGWMDGWMHELENAWIEEVKWMDG
jgi:hypothetical protein